MEIIKGTGAVPVIYTAHHASHNFGEFEPRVALNEQQKVRFSDYGTDETVPGNGIVAIVAERSRALGDLNRNPDDPGRFQSKDYGKPDRHDIWKQGQGLSTEEKNYLQQNIYEPFHQKIIDELKIRKGLTFVVAWDNTAHYIIGTDTNDKPVTMKPIILSNRGTEEGAYAGVDEEVSCDPDFLPILADNLSSELGKRNLPNEVHLNLVMRGGYICRQYSTLRNRSLLEGLGVTSEVQSLQVEYDTSMTHDQATLEPNRRAINALREAFSCAIESAYDAYSNRNR